MQNGFQIDPVVIDKLQVTASADPEGGQGVLTPPPGKSQVMWVCIGNRHLDPPPPPPGKGWTPPPRKYGPPLEPLKTIDFFEIDHLTSVK